VKGAQNTDIVDETFYESREVPSTTHLVRESDDLEKLALQDVAEDVTVEEIGYQPLKSESAQNSMAVNDGVIEDGEYIIDNSDALGQPSMQGSHRKSNSLWQTLTSWRSPQDRGETLEESRAVPATTRSVKESDVFEDALVEEIKDTVPISESVQGSAAVNDVVVDDVEYVMDKNINSAFEKRSTALESNEYPEIKNEIQYKYDLGRDRELTVMEENQKLFESAQVPEDTTVDSLPQKYSTTLLDTASIKGNENNSNESSKGIYYY
jgi:hypothetical protein